MHPMRAFSNALYYYTYRPWDNDSRAQDCEFYVLETAAFDKLLRSTVKESMDTLHTGTNGHGP
jgi:hypothetical protein